jgi:dTDP-4-dehydrorhamnose 3,5-epimerase
MIFTETPLPGAFLVELEPRGDARGFFARSFCVREFEAHGLKPIVAQANLSFNHRTGTLRGLHYQAPPAAETKLVRCTAGVIWDVIVDIRPGSPTFRKSFGVELSAGNRRALYVPEMFAHGYLTLSDGAEVVYSVGEFYTPGAEGGFRWNDPVLAIDWPIPVAVISEKDAAWPLIGAGK